MRRLSAKGVLRTFVPSGAILGCGNPAIKSIVPLRSLRWSSCGVSWMKRMSCFWRAASIMARSTIRPRGAVPCSFRKARGGTLTGMPTIKRGRAVNAGDAGDAALSEAPSGPDRSDPPGARIPDAASAPSEADGGVTGREEGAEESACAEMHMPPIPMRASMAATVDRRRARRPKRRKTAMNISLSALGYPTAVRQASEKYVRENAHF